MNYIGGNTPVRRKYIDGMRIGSHLDQVREFIQQPPKYISRWGRIDCIYNWIGLIIRLKRHHWTGDKAVPYGIVVEVGRTSWLAALWTDGTSPCEQIAVRDIDSWSPPHVHSLKNEMLERRHSEEWLLQFLRNLDYQNLSRR